MDLRKSVCIFSNANLTNCESFSSKTSVLAVFLFVDKWSFVMTTKKADCCTELEKKTMSVLKKATAGNN